MSTLFDWLPSESPDFTHFLMPCMAPACTLVYDLEESSRRLTQRLAAYVTLNIAEITCPDCLSRWGGIEGLRAEIRRQTGNQARIVE